MNPEGLRYTVGVLSMWFSFRKITMNSAWRMNCFMSLIIMQLLICHPFVRFISTRVTLLSLPDRTGHFLLCLSALCLYMECGVAQLYFANVKVFCLPWWQCSALQEERQGFGLRQNRLHLAPPSTYYVALDKFLTLIKSQFPQKNQHWSHTHFARIGWKKSI